jgi:methyl-accepting chemotaxis protein
MMRLKLKSKMLISFILAIIIVMAGVTVITSRVTQSTVTDNLSAVQEVISRIAAYAARTGLEFDDKDELASALRAFTTQSLFSYISVVNKQGQEVFHYRKEGLAPLRNLQLLRKRGGADLTVADDQPLEDTADEMFKKIPVESTSGQLGTVVLGISLEERNKSLSSARLALATLSVLMIILFFTITLVLANRISKPIEAIAAIAGDMAQGNLQRDIPIRRGDEIGALANAFRDLAAYIRGIAEAADHLSAGQISSIQVVTRSKHDMLARAFQRVVDTLRELLQEIETLIQAARDGRLNERGNARKFQGGYAQVVEGINLLLEQVVAPINEAAAVLQHVAAHDLTARMQGAYKGDFIKIKTALNQAAEEMSLALGTMAENAGTLAGSSEELKTVSEKMSSNAEETSAQTTVVSAAAEQVSKNVQTAATGAEEMGSSIREIAKNAAEAAKVAAQAVKVADATNATVASLGESSAEIGDVVKMISSVAFQTNLLALNATIEAARAGDAGKGFAVVANQVKELAQETSQATEDIGRKIEAIQGSTRGAVESIAQISDVIKQINDISNTIASAMEEQSATTNEITRSITEAARGSSEIAQNISGIMQAAESTTSGANDTLNAAGELTRMAAALQNLVGQFKYAAQQDGYGEIAPQETLPVRRVEEAMLLSAKRTNRGLQRKTFET